MAYIHDSTLGSFGCGPSCMCSDCRRTVQGGPGLGERYVEDDGDERPSPPAAPPPSSRPVPAGPALSGWRGFGLGELSGLGGPGEQPSDRTVEEVARRQRDALLRDCTGVRMLEWLDRFSPAERVCHWEKVLRVLPGAFRMKAALAQRVREGKMSAAEAAAKLAELLEKMGYPRGYALGSEADEMALARCRFARAKWEFCAEPCFGPVGRRMRFERAPGGSNPPGS